MSRSRRHTPITEITKSESDTRDKVLAHRRQRRRVRTALASGRVEVTTRCLTYEEQSLGRLQTICGDGTRAVSTYNRTLERWDTTVTPPPGQTCTGQLNPRTRPWEGRCREARR
jgi:hypothetical protein